MTLAIDFRLYLVTDRHLCAPRTLPSVVRAACDAGVRAVQLREKDLDANAIDALVDRLLAITSRAGATLFVNQAHTSSLIARTGLHFPEPIAIGKTDSAGPIGASTHSIEAAKAAVAAGADFITFGPVYETPAKARFGPPQGLERLGQITAGVDIPVFAIGGVTPERARACLDAGAHGVAVMGNIMTAPDTAAAVHAFKNALGRL